MLQAIRSAIVKAARETQGPEDVRVLAELVDAYNNMRDWVDG